jgi:Ca2+-binding RTX toxin-like protein
LGGDGADNLYGDAGFDKLVGEAGADRLWGGAGADWFVFKGAGALGGGDRIEDFQDGVDRIVLEKLGVTKYAAGGGLGTVFARDGAGGNVFLDVVTSAGAKFSIDVADPTASLTAANFTASDFILV